MYALGALFSYVLLLSGKGYINKPDHYSVYNRARAGRCKVQPFIRM